MGDKSDNIPPVFPKCGEKTAKKCIDNDEYFQEKITNVHENNLKYELNTKLIDFDYIPEELVKEFIQTMLLKHQLFFKGVNNYAIFYKIIAKTNWYFVLNTHLFFLLYYLFQ